LTFVFKQQNKWRACSFERERSGCYCCAQHAISYDLASIEQGSVTVTREPWRSFVPNDISRSHAGRGRSHHNIVRLVLASQTRFQRRIV
jgi:hypothetical protein